MGRSLSWYVVKLPKEHDKTQPICLDLEFEPEKDDFDTKFRLYQIVCPEIVDVPENLAQYKEMSKVWHTYKYNKKDQWCQKCLFYNSGIYGSDCIIDSIDIHHSYSNKIWWSEWNVRDMYLGSDRTDLMRRFSSEHLYREVLDVDIMDAYQKLERLGDPIRKSDVEAKEETIQVLEFLKQYMDRDDVCLIMQDEY
jgi:hypothetical protein